MSLNGTSTVVPSCVSATLRSPTSSTKAFSTKNEGVTTCRGASPPSSEKIPASLASASPVGYRRRLPMTREEVEKVLPMIMRGEGLNDRYRNC